MLPAKGDPRRPLASAVLLTRTLGASSIALAALLLMLAAGSSPVMLGMVMVVLLLSVGVMLGLPGLACIAISFALERRRTWAAITILVIAGLQLPLLFVTAVRAMRASEGDVVALLVLAGLPGLLTI